MKQEINPELIKKAEMYRRGMSRNEAKSRLETVIGGRKQDVALINDNDGEHARLNRKVVGKLVSSTAARKSANNGFTQEQHFAVASDIDCLYRNSLKLWSHADKDANPDIAAIHRYAAPLHFDGAIALMTIKESMQYGRKMYSVEVLEIKRLEAVLEEVRDESRAFQPASSKTSPEVTTAQGDRPSTVAAPGAEELGGMLAGEKTVSSNPPSAPSFHNDNIRDLLAKVNSGGDFF